MPAAGPTFVHHPLRLPPEYIDRAGDLVPWIRQAPEFRTHGRVTRSDVERLAMARGLAMLEQEFLPAREQATLPGVEP